MMSTRSVHNNTHVGFLLIVFSRIKYIQLLGLNHALWICDAGSWSFTEVTLQFSIISFKLDKKIATSIFESYAL